MPRVKQASKQKRTTKAAAVTVLGATGLGFSLLGSASASTMPAADIAQSDNTPPNQRFVLSEEEMADVSLATFHLFDKENVGRGVQASPRGAADAVAAVAAVAARSVAAVAARSVAARSVPARLAARSAAQSAAVAHLGDIAACAKSHDLHRAGRRNADRSRRVKQCRAGCHTPQLALECGQALPYPQPQPRPRRLLAHPSAPGHERHPLQYRIAR